MKKLFANKKGRYRNLILLILPFVILVCILGFVAFRGLKDMMGTITNDPAANQSYSDIISMDYHLRGNATDLQKDLFKELQEKADAEGEEKDDVATATAVAKNFVADFYTWTNKSGQSDIGGMYYVYSPSRINIYSQARDGFYHYLSHYINEYGRENLLEVDTIEANGSQLSDADRYAVDDVSYDTYYVTVRWTYKPSAKFDTSKFRTEENFTIIKNSEGRFEIVQAY
ncbi:MAG: hypothetical protein IKE21_02460 [Erysipelotrichaceae bacterium]|nr:hypothetical protein [Erysipelotrichaceae bacterium]